VQRKQSEISENDATIESITNPNRSQAVSSQNTTDHLGNANPYNFTGFDSSLNLDINQHNRKNVSSGSSVVSMGSEFAQRARSLVHLMNCHSGKRDGDFSPLASENIGQQQHSSREW